MAWGGWRGLITRAIIPLGDLGIASMPPTPLSFPDDVAPVLALMVVQTPDGPRMLQTNDMATVGSTAQTAWYEGSVTAATWKEIIPAVAGKRIIVYYATIIAEAATGQATMTAKDGTSMVWSSANAAPFLFFTVLPPTGGVSMLAEGTALGITTANTVAKIHIAVVYGYAT